MTKQKKAQDKLHRVIAEAAAAAESTVVASARNFVLAEFDEKRRDRTMAVLALSNAVDVHIDIENIHDAFTELLATDDQAMDSEKVQVA